MKIKKHLFYILGFISVAILGYFPLVFSFFVHDEWQAFLNFSLADKNGYLEGLKHFILMHPGQYTPLSEGLTFSVFHFFHQNYLIYFFLGMALHALCGYLVFILVNKLIKNKALSLIAGILFILAPNHFQATSWIIANTGYSMSTAFLVGGIIFFFNWIENKSLKDALIGSLMFLLSILSKPITIFIFLALPLLTYLWTKDKIRSLQSILIGVPILLFNILDYFYIKNFPQSDFSVTSKPSLQSIATLPLRQLAESILPQHLIYSLAKFGLFFIPPISFEKLSTTIFNQQVEGIGALLVTILISFLTLIIGYKLYKKKKSIFHFKLYLTGLILTALSGLPYIFVDTPSFSLLQPRYLYVGVAMILISLFGLLAYFYKAHKFKVTVILMILIVSFTISDWYMSYKNAIINIERKNVLSQITNAIPKGSQNTVLFIESDTSYYGMPESIKTLPFQASSGKVLAASLEDKVYLPVEVFKYEIFKDIDSQGLYKDNQGSFGYFRSYKDLKSTFSKDKISSSSVFAFSYKGREKVLIDETNSVRKKLSQ